jgi:aminopeptidase YwaD
MRKWFYNCLYLCLLVNVFGQDMNYTKQVLLQLCSEKFHGRGYVNNGCNKAGVFLEKEFKSIGLEPINGSYRQAFSFPVNTFPKQVQLSINGQTLDVGKDFILDAGSISVKKETELIWDSINKVFADLSGGCKIRLAKKLTFTVSQNQNRFTEFIVLRDSSKAWQTSKIIRAKVNVKAKFLNDYSVYNLIGSINGTSNIDSTIVVSAHYDHLGRLGNAAYFPGANDNASGVSMLLNLAKTIKLNPLKYNVVFILFAGEEAGLLGSHYFVDHPIFPLNKIKFLVNLDLNGTGDDGATVVNSTIYTSAFDKLKKINDDQRLLSQLKTRGKAANSDHYWFTEKGVPAFFIYTMGGISAYHDIYDRPETLPLTKYKELHQLLLNFMQQL